MKTTNQLNIEAIFNHIAKGKSVAEYLVTETYLHPGFATLIAGLKVKCNDLDDAKLFASNNRRHEQTLIEIFDNGKLVSSQKSCYDAWINEVV